MSNTTTSSGGIGFTGLLTVLFIGLKPPYSDKVSRASPYSTSLSKPFRVQDYHPLWLHFPEHSTRT